MGNNLSNELFDDSLQKEDKPRSEKRRKRSRTLRRKPVEPSYDYTTDEEDQFTKKEEPEPETNREYEPPPSIPVPKKKRKPITYKSRNN